MFRLVALAFLGQLPQDTLQLPQDTLSVAMVVPAPAEREMVTIPPARLLKLEKDIFRFEESLNHQDDRLRTVEARSKFAANAVNKLGAGSPTVEEIRANLPEGTGIDGWDQSKPRNPPVPATAPRTAVGTSPAAPAGYVWCAQCGRYEPIQAAQVIAPPAARIVPTYYQPPAQNYYQAPSYQPPAYQRSGYQPQAQARPARRSGFS